MATGSACMESAPATEATPATPATGLDPHVRAAWLCLAAALVSGGLLWMCYHPLAWGFLGWVALVPFLILVRAQTKPRFLYFCAWLCGLAFFGPALQWMRVADYRMYATWAMLATYCSLYLPLALWLLRCLDPWRIPLIVTVPLVWAALEYFRSFFLTGFGWYLLAHTQHDTLSMIQIADFGGVYVVSFLVAAVNAFLFDCIWQVPEIRAWFRQSELEPYRTYASLDLLNRCLPADWLFRRNLILEGLVLGILLVSTFVYGSMRLSQNRFDPGPTVCMLQSNLDQRLRNDAGAPDNDGQSGKAIAKHYSELCARAVKDHYPPPDLIIWPETSFPLVWVEVSQALPISKVPTFWRQAESDIRDDLRDMGAKYTRIPHLLGMNANVLDEQSRHRRYNSALFLNADGQVTNRFDKMHRVPFGEYVPLKEWLPFMNSFSPYDYDYGIQRGEKFTRFALKKHHFGVLICFEDTDPFLARRYMQPTEDGPVVDFLVNMSNDGWFDGTSEHEEHLAVSRFRAIECRRAMVRAVNMGVSALIDSNGRVLKPTRRGELEPPVWVAEPISGRMSDLPLSEWRHFKKVGGILTANIPIDHRASLYPVVGDWLPIGCWACLLGGFGWSWYRRRQLAAVSGPRSASA